MKSVNNPYKSQREKHLVNSVCFYKLQCCSPSSHSIAVFPTNTSVHDHILSSGLPVPFTFPVTWNLTLYRKHKTVQAVKISQAEGVWWSPRCYIVRIKTQRVRSNKSLLGNAFKNFWDSEPWSWLFDCLQLRFDFDYCLISSSVWDISSVRAAKADSQLTTSRQPPKPCPNFKAHQQGSQSESYSPT